MPRDVSTIKALRSDLALQIARHVKRLGQSQIAMAKRLGIPQPTLSKIVNAQVGELSLELLIRIAVRARLPVVLQTGVDPEEAGVHVVSAPGPQRTHPSNLADHARDALAQSHLQLTPEQRLEAQLQHSQLLITLQKSAKAGRK
jgi:predicted XRE-type DNA-binding protein